MRICLVSPNFPPMSWPCGAADFVSKLARNLQKAGNEVTVVTSNPDVNPREWPFEVTQIPGSWNLSHVRKIAKHLRKQPYDLVELQYEAGMYRYTSPSLLLPLFLKPSKTPLFLTLHSQDLPRRGGRLWRFPQILPYDGIIFYSRQFYDRIARWFPRRTARFLLQGFPANITQAVSADAQPLIQKLKAGYLDQSFLMAYFGHIQANRGIEDVLEAMKELKKDGLKPHFVLISGFDAATNDYQRGLLDWLEAHGMKDQVSFTGRLADSEVSRFLSAADACVLPFVEGASFKNGSLAAAIEHGIATITTTSELTEKELTESGALLTYAPGDRAALKARISHLMRDPKARAEAARRTQSLRHLFSWKDYIDKRMSFYSRILGEREKKDAHGATPHAARP